MAPELVGLIDATPKSSIVDKSERLSLRDSIPDKRSLALAAEETKKVPFISGISRKKFGHVSMIRPLKIGGSKKRSIRKSKRSALRRAAIALKKRSVNEADMPQAFRRSSIQIEAFDSKSTIQPQVKSPLLPIDAMPKTTMESNKKSENVTVADMKVEAAPKIAAANETATKEEKNNVTATASAPAPAKKKSEEFPSAEDSLLQMTHNLLSDITEFHDNVDDVKEATVTRKGDSLNFAENVEKLGKKKKRNEIAAAAGNNKEVSPLNVLISKSIFEDYLINRFMSYVCAEC